MNILSPVLVLIAGEPAFYCPGCKILHRINVNESNARNGSRWTWNGDSLYPTFKPSISVCMFPGKVHCRCTVTTGRIMFAKECLHDLAGESVPLPDIPIEEMGY